MKKHSVKDLTGNNHPADGRSPADEKKAADDHSHSHPLKIYLLYNLT